MTAKPNTLPKVLPNALPKVLIVDDDHLNAKLLAANIRSSEYEIALAYDGNQCLQLLREVRPDLILLDVMMPEMDGFEVCSRIKADERSTDIPILFMTALTDEQYKTQGFTMGAVDYITKPFNEAEVKARVQTHLALKASRDALRRQNFFLDDQVQARTAELSQANAQLKAEIKAKDQAHHQLQISEAANRAIVDALPDEVFRINGGQKIIEHKGAGRIFSVDPQQVLGMPLARLLPEGMDQEVQSQVTQVLESAQTAILDFPVILADKKRHCEARLVKIDSDQVLLIARDITRQKRSQEALIEKEQVLSQENQRLKASLKDRYRFGDLIGASQVMQQVYDLILQASAHNINVMVYGESGTGKELVAQAIHSLSDRKERTFIPVNCGAIPENLVESEFFGYRKGAFTGAVENNPGYLSRAHGGTLFLDEIGDISLNMQVKLLRAIEGGGFTPIGGRQPAKSDVRFIGATNRDLKKLVAEGQMREDFFYRVHIVTIELPPLREREGDLPLLIKHFYQQFTQALDDPPPLNGKVLDALINYHWPGNIRELQNTLQRYISSRKIDFMGTPLEIEVQSCPDPLPLPDTPQDFQTAMQDFEKRLILHALEHHRWHREKAAQSLNIPRRTFFRKLKNLGIAAA